jgi:hypothetical protein
MARPIAIAVVSMYKITVLVATAPIRELLPRDETPQTRDTKTKGTTSNFNERTKICPTVSNSPSTNMPSMVAAVVAERILKEKMVFKSAPQSRPSSIAIIILCVRLIN